jgi:hypothetical protein
MFLVTQFKPSYSFKIVSVVLPALFATAIKSDIFISPTYYKKNVIWVSRLDPTQLSKLGYLYLHCHLNNRDIALIHPLTIGD